MTLRRAEDYGYMWGIALVYGRVTSREQRARMRSLHLHMLAQTDPSLPQKLSVMMLQILRLAELLEPRDA